MNKFGSNDANKFLLFLRHPKEDRTVESSNEVHFGSLRSFVCPAEMGRGNQENQIWERETGILLLSSRSGLYVHQYSIPEAASKSCSRKSNKTKFKLNYLERKYLK